MDISNIGVQYMNSSYIPLSSPSAASLPNAGDGSFAEILKKVQNSQASQSGSVSAVTSAKTPVDKASKLYELCMELETFLIKNLIKSMRGTVQKTKLIDTGFAGEIYEDMLYDEYAKTFAHNANLGFAELAYRELAGLR